MLRMERERAIGAGLRELDGSLLRVRRGRWSDLDDSTPGARLLLALDLLDTAMSMLRLRLGRDGLSPEEIEGGVVEWLTRERDCGRSLVVSQRWPALR